MEFNQLMAIARVDRIKLRRWWSEQTVTKIFVVVGFMVVFGFLMTLFFAVGSVYFRSLFSYERFGILTARYLIRAVILMMFWLGIISSTVAGLVQLVRENRERDYLITMPVKSKVLVIWWMINGWVMNLMLMMIIFVPVSWSYGRVAGIDWREMVVRMVIVLGMIAGTSQAFGGVASHLIAKAIKGWGVFTGMMITVLVLLLSSLAIIKSIFPTELQNLYKIDINKFADTYQNLPLNQPAVLTNTAAELLTGGWSITAAIALLGVIILFTISAILQSKDLYSDCQGMREGRPVEQKSNKNNYKYLSNNFSLTKKDVFSVLRVPGEWVYGMVLILMVVVFMWLIRMGSMNRGWINTREFEITVISLWWFLFLGSTYLLRIVFPLTMKEGKAKWWLFSLPLTRGRIMLAKMVAGLALAIPMMILSIDIWLFLPMGKDHGILPAITGLIVIVCLYLINVAWGMVNPDFNLGNEPDKITTSLSGLVTLALSIVMITTACYFFYMIRSGAMTMMKGGLEFAGLMTVIVLVSLLLGYGSVRKYNK